MVTMSSVDIEGLTGYTAFELKTAFASVDGFTRTFTYNPDDNDDKFKPFPYQTKFFNIIDFGYDPADCVYKPTDPPAIVVMMTPRQYGKSVAISKDVLPLFIRYGGNIGILSNKEDNAIELLDKVQREFEMSPFSEMVVSRKQSELTVARNGMTFKIYSFGQVETIRSKSLRFLFLDEAAQHDEKILAAAMPTVEIAGAFMQHGTPDIIMTSTPFGQDNTFYNYLRRGLESREVCCRQCGFKRALSDSTFKGIRFPARDMPDDMVDCPQCQANDFAYLSNGIAVVVVDPYSHPFKTRAMIDKKVELAGNTARARQEYLAEVASDDIGVFQRNWLDQCMDVDLYNKRERKQDTDYVVSIDYGKSHDATVIGVGHRDSRTDAIIYDYQYRIPGGEAEYRDIRYEFLQIVAYFRPYMIVPDATGIGDPMVEQMEQDLLDLQEFGINGVRYVNGTRIPYKIRPVYDLNCRIYNNKTNRLGFVFDYTSKMNLIDNLSNILQKGKVRIPDERILPILWKELLRFGYSKSNNNRIIYGTQMEHDDTVIALALLCWGMRQNPYYYSQAQLGDADHYVL